MADLAGSKKRLVDALREKALRYWELMKNWYRRRITKEEFDSKARSMLGEGNLHLHNEFLFAILVKCQIGSPDPEEPLPSPAPSLPQPVPAKKPKLVFPPQEAVVTYGALDPLQYHSPPKVQLIPKDLDSLLLCTHELILPATPILHARMLLGAWEVGLEGVSDEAAEMMSLALQYQMMTVLQTLVSQQSSWSLRDGRFPHAFGHGSSRPSEGGVVDGELCEGDRREVEAMRRVSRHKGGGALEPLSLFHLRDALKVQPQCIPVRAVFACTLERVLLAMWHASVEEDEQRGVVERWRLAQRPPALFTVGTRQPA